MKLFTIGIFICGALIGLSAANARFFESALPVSYVAPILREVKCIRNLILSDYSGTDFMNQWSEVDKKISSAFADMLVCTNYRTSFDNRRCLENEAKKANYHLANFYGQLSEATMDEVQELMLNCDRKLLIRSRYTSRLPKNGDTELDIEKIISKSEILRQFRCVQKAVTSVVNGTSISNLWVEADANLGSTLFELEICSNNDDFCILERALQAILIIENFGHWLENNNHLDLLVQIQNAVNSQCNK